MGCGLFDTAMRGKRKPVAVCPGAREQRRIVLH